MSSHAFGQYGQLFIDTVLQNQKDMLKNSISKLPITENRIENLLLVRFLFPFLFRQMVEKLCIPIGPPCIISVCVQDHELKFSTQTNFDALIPNLKFHFQYDIVMTSDDVIFEKSVK